ncbi:drug resistance transporter, EmrB/QacA subfamily [Catenulispora acidiphila DSM 44928]|uniref:Drug resistance transporter, EmrB/QacA subfamily n=1 Tax=Catenulispora acidiphila (strain DSM 44928 / JCM 14897 / NBRC 102108 / NRRL B-24433 / ID139908) TaxID=479433 RepID=C7QEL5_CATAD|nr:MFS transporter [Catenulispora acidiphila]ACU72785.1 drug resistance transporter, EmrB/QacA subfamily [Catenulispora acidiphila DSM 44928]
MPALDLSQSPRRWPALAALTLSVLIVGLDGTVINVALPTIAGDLHTDSAQLQWISGGYLLALSVAMLPVGLLGDRYGHRRLLLSGIAVFGAASLVGSLADSPTAVIAARAVLGLGAAAILPLSMAILPRVFSKDEQPRAIAVWTAATALGMPVGPVVGGWLLNHFWWGSVFLFNVPVAVVALAAGLWLLPRDAERTSAAPPFDTLGALLGGLGITALVYGTILISEDGWTAPSVLASLSAAAALLAGFVVRERRFPHPLVDFALFGDRRFRWGTLIAVFVNFAVMGILFVVPQYLQSVLGNDAFGTGIRVLPLIGGLMLSAALSEFLLPRLGVRLVVTTGLLVLAAGVLFGATTGAADGYGFAAGWLGLTGLGFGLAVVPATSLVLGTLPDHGTGSGTSLLETIQQLGSALGVAGLGSLLSYGYLARLHTGRLPTSEADAARDSVSDADALAGQLHDAGLAVNAHASFVHGMSLVLLVCGVIALLGAGLAAAFLPRHAGAPGAGQVSGTVAEPAESIA